MKRNSGILVFLAFVLMFAQLPGIQSTYAASSGNQNVQVTKVVNPSEILEGGVTEITVNVQGTPDRNFVKPNDVILIIDRSGSMAGSYGPNNGEDKMKNAIEAAKGFIDLVDFSKHRIGIVDFSDESSIGSKALSTDAAALKQYVNGIQAGGGTGTKKAIEKARELLANHRPDAQPVIILLTDGQATQPAPDENARIKALEEAGVAKSEGIVFYTIALLLKTEDPLTSAPNLLMKEMATTAHHHHFVLGSVGLAEIYNAIVEEIGVASAYDVKVTDYVSPEFEIVPNSYTDNIPQPVVTNNTLTWSFLELKNELLTFKYKIRHKSGAAVGDLPAGDKQMKVEYKNYLGVKDEYSVVQPTVKVKHYAPIITSVVKDNGLVQGGEQVVINGENFRPNLKVHFGSTQIASVQYVSNNQLIVTAPAGVQGSVPVKVTNDDGQFATAEYRYYAIPEITSVLPAEGPIEGGTKVVINGNYFMPGAQVLFGNNLAIINKNAVKSLEVTAPAGLTPGPVSITVNNPDQTTVTKQDAFNYIQGPDIILITPNVGERAGGQQVTIEGQRFVDGAKVYFNTKLVTSSFVSSGELKVTTPSWGIAETVAVKVVNPNGQQSLIPNGYTYEDDSPVISSVSPTSGPMAGGTIITVKGSYFKSGAKVNLGEIEVPVYTFVSTSEIRFKAPSWSKPELVDLKIVNPDGKAAEAKGVFQYLAPPDPTLTSLSPTSGLVSGGTQITINGTDLPSDVKVYFDNQEVVPTSITTTKITVTSPEWATPEKVDIRIQTTSGFEAILIDAFEYLPLPKPPAPLISSISPSKGSVIGGTTVTINGSNFVNGLKLYFDQQEVSYTFVSSSSLRIKTPAWTTAESVDVIITNPDNQSAQLNDGYTYEPLPGPQLKSVSPNIGPVAGGTIVKLTGSNFKSDTTVYLANKEIQGTFVSSTELRITTPEWDKSETVDVKVVNSDGQESILTGGYTFELPPPLPEPVITGLTPNSGPQEGGTVVSIKGANFTANSILKFEDTIVAATMLSSTELRIKTPAWPSAATVEVSITNEEGKTASLSDAYTFVAPPEKPEPIVTSISPGSIEFPGSGVIVTISGQNFQNGAKVYFKDVALAATFVSASQLRIKTPAWSTAEQIDVTVENPDGKVGVLIGGFTYLAPPPPPAPVVNSISPNTGVVLKSSTVTLTGNNFVNGAKVKFGDIEISSTYISTTQLRVATPVWATPETVTVTVTNPDGQQGQLINGFSFIQDVPPVLTSLSPNTGLISGGGTVTVNGNNFKNGSKLLFGGQELAATYVSASQLRIKVPAWSNPEVIDVIVVNPDGQQSDLLVGGYVYTAPAPKPAPVVTSLSPATGSVKGGTTVTLNGKNFQSGATVEINGVVVASTYLSSTQLRFKTPASAVSGPVTIRVINPDGQISDVLVDGFTYQ